MKIKVYYYFAKSIFIFAISGSIAFSLKRRQYSSRKYEGQWSFTTEPACIWLISALVSVFVQCLQDGDIVMAENDFTSPAII